MCLGYNLGTMDVVPLYRRPGFIALLGFGITAVLYYWALNAAIEITTPGILPADTLLLLGLLSAIALFVFIANLIFYPLVCLRLKYKFRKFPLEAWLFSVIKKLIFYIISYKNKETENLGRIIS